FVATNARIAVIAPLSFSIFAQIVQANWSAALSDCQKSKQAKYFNRLIFSLHSGKFTLLKEFLCTLTNN
ncbi:MAG TPA: hypothetical protein PLN38_03245, partial [Chitinophagales bacterium]|nr:hypothetical protein [Chitinophagales bacterium]